MLLQLKSQITDAYLLQNKAADDELSAALLRFIYDLESAEIVPEIFNILDSNIQLSE